MIFTSLVCYYEREQKIFQVESFHVRTAQYMAAIIIISIIFLFERESSQRVSFEIFDFRPGLANCGPKATTNQLPAFVQLMSYESFHTKSIFFLNKML